jgi:peptidoglycan/xylan/chitin deacetylase (PgdA/CDA1 family)
MRSAGAILAFHSVTTPTLPGESAVHLPVGEVRSLIEAARQLGELVPLRDLIDRHRDGRSTAGLIALTMDDAYAAWLLEAADFVRREAIPLTVFVVTQAATRTAPYWWDRVDDLFPQVDGRRWRAFEDACGLTDDYRTGQPVEYGPLRPFRQWMLAAHAGRWPDALEPLLHDLEQETGTRTAQRSMTFEELERFAAIPSVDLGVHTATHPVLPLLADAELVQEITTAHRALRDRFRNVVPVLAVPFGLFDRRTVARAREAGMAASLTLAGTTLRRWRDQDDLPRFCMSREETPLKLRLRLVGVLDWVRALRVRTAPRYPALPSATT